MRAATSFACLLYLCSCDGGGTPSLLPIAPVSARVNETLRIELSVDNPNGAAVSLRVEGPILPGFEAVTMVSSHPGGGTFTWVPLSSHVGTHEVTFVLTAGDGGEYDRESVLIDIQPDADAAPVFVRPGAGGTYDLSLDPCVGFDIEVRDDDSPTVTLGLRRDPPEGGVLSDVADKRARFEWCPTTDQIAASERWTIELFADDGEHPRVEHDYIVVLRAGPGREGCPGTAPVVTPRSPLANERITSGGTYPVEFDVTDDMGLRDPPLVYYTRTAPEDPTKLDLTQFSMVVSASTGGNAYRGQIPSFGLAEGQEATVYYFVSASDNDDATGSACDHRTDSALIAFVAVGGARASGTLTSCASCSASIECASGVCASSATGGRCLDACASGSSCTRGTCGATVTVEGSSRSACGSVRDVCETASLCTDDGRENDDTAATATSLASPVTDGQICSGDDDYFSIAVASGSRATVTLDGFTHTEGDLELQLRTATGTVLASSASAMNVETVRYCNSTTAPATFYARVYGYNNAQNHYALRASVAADSSCCVDDTTEIMGGDTQATALPLIFAPSPEGDRAAFDGRICSSDSDWFTIPMNTAGRIQVYVTFTHANGDIDIALHNSAGTRIASSLSATDDESIDVEVAAGTYALRVYGYGEGNQDGYLGEVTLGAGIACASTFTCPPDEVCEGASCSSDACTTNADCPAMHSCPTAGPEGTPRHCAASCTVNSECRSVEACKWFIEGRGCARRGSGANGDACASYAECGGQRACLPWPGGYCARASCSSNADCEDGTFCVSSGGINVCALHCVTTNCRSGYRCAYLPTMGDVNRFVCVP